MSKNNAFSDFESEGFNEVDLHEIFYKYLYNWYWFAFSLILCMLIAYAYIKLQVPQYKIQTDILIKENKDASLSSQNDLLKQLNLNTSDKIIDNEIEILKSNTLMEKVVQSLDLQTSYYSKKTIRKHELYKNTPFRIELLQPSASSYDSEWPVKLLNDTEVLFNEKKIHLNQPVQTPQGLILITLSHNTNFANSANSFWVHFNEIQKVSQNYISKLKIEPASKESTVLIITLEDASPERGEDILNKLIDEYNQAAVEDKNKVNSTTLAFVNERIGILNKELNSVETNVENYKANNQITNITSESALFLQNVHENDAELNKVQIELNDLGNLQKFLTNSKDEAEKLPSLLGITDPTLLALVSKLGETELRKEGLIRTIPETNPVIISLNDQIASIKHSIDQTVSHMKNGLEMTRNYLETKNKTFESSIKQVPSKERGLIDVMRQQEIKNSLFTYLLQKREESALSLASTVSDSRTIDKAMCSNTPIKPVKSMIYLLSMVAGLIIPVIFIYLKEALNYKINKKSDIEKLTSVPIISEISRSDNLSPLVSVEKPRTMVAEQIRTLRTNLSFIAAEQKQKVLLFTSMISGEGKSFISLNLGASLAMSGKKVIILELDLRKPRLHGELGIDNTNGLSNYLANIDDYKEIIKPIPQQENYFILTSGPIPPNPAELLANGRLGDLILQLKKKFDYIILDAPPIGLVTDAQIIENYVDATLFIIRHQYSIKNNVKVVEDFNQKKRFKNMNIIFNSIDRSQDYGYNYGYGYYEEGKKKKYSKLGSFFNKKDH